VASGFLQTEDEYPAAFTKLQYTCYYSYCS